MNDLSKMGYCSTEWDAPRSLKDMFPEDIAPEILEEVDDYKLHLIIPAEIEDFSLFKTDLGKAMRYIAVSEDPEKIEELCKDTDFEKVSRDTVHLINECTNSNIKMPRGQEEINMCKGLEGYGKKMQEEGRSEERVATIQKMIINGYTKKQILDLEFIEGEYNEAESRVCQLA